MGSTSVAIIGPTACGKTARAVMTARRFDGEIISADSRQIYRGMSIGTGKDLCEYGDVHYHLIDICEPGTQYNLHRYLQAFHAAWRDVVSRGHTPVICGGSGMYVENALNGISMPDVAPDMELRRSLENRSLPELTEILKQYKQLHNTTDVDTVKRAVRAIEICEYYRRHPDEAATADRNRANKIPAVVIGIDIPRDERRRRITERLRTRLEEGMAEEVRALLESGIPADNLIYYGLEYKYVTLYVTGVLTYDEMFVQLETAIHQFAKRQMTWFRGMDKRGTHINWLPFDMPENEFLDAVGALIAEFEKNYKNTIT